jgi:hypothetical protein
MSQRRIPFRTTATACLVALGLLGTGVAEAKVRYSPVLATTNDSDVFYCGLLNTHPRNVATIFVYEEVQVIE